MRGANAYGVLSKQALALEIVERLLVDDVALRVFVLFLLLRLPAFLVLLALQLLPHCRTRSTNQVKLELHRRNRPQYVVRCVSWA